MTIVVNARFLQDEMEGYGYFTKEVFMRLTQQKPQHQFIFLFDRPHNPTINFPTNVKPVVLTPKARHVVSFRWWFDVKVPFALRKYKANVFVSPDGFCSLTTSVPQVLVVHDLAFLHYPNFLPLRNLWFYKTHTKKFIEKARVVCTVSEFSKKDIIDKFKVSESKILNVESAAKQIFKAIEWQEKEDIKNEFADGFEYFVFVGGIHPRKNLMNLLKAFSIFKKWQRTNMKLLVVGRLAWKYEDVKEKLETYKYRNEVKMIGYLPEEKLVKVVAAAYALIFPSFFEGFGVPVLEAMQSGVPVIASDTSSIPEVGGDAALYADPSSPNEIAEKMKMIFKDEKLRNDLILKGTEQARKFSWERTAELMWQAIEKAVT